MVCNCKAIFTFYYDTSIYGSTKMMKMVLGCVSRHKTLSTNPLIRVCPAIIFISTSQPSKCSRYYLHIRINILQNIANSFVAQSFCHMYAISEKFSIPDRIAPSWYRKIVRSRLRNHSEELVARLRLQSSTKNPTDILSDNRILQSLRIRLRHHCDGSE